eukprot:ctg_477.g151
MQQHCDNALVLARWLERCMQEDEGRRNIRRVLYPGLPSHPQHHLALRNAVAPDRMGGMIAFYAADALHAITRLRYITLAESLGGVESLIEVPARMTHLSVSAEERQRLGIDDELVRFSVGIEHVDDLQEDVADAFRREERRRARGTCMEPEDRGTGERSGVRPPRSQPRDGTRRANYPATIKDRLPWECERVIWTGGRALELVERQSLRWSQGQGGGNDRNVQQSVHVGIMRPSSRRVTMLSVIAVTSLVTLLCYWGLHYVPAAVENASRGSRTHSSSSVGRERARRELQQLAVVEHLPVLAHRGQCCGPHRVRTAIMGIPHAGLFAAGR